MRAGRSRTISAGCAALAATALCLGASSAPALAEHPLEPDLVTVKLQESELQVAQDGKKTLLRLANRVGNTGQGPLEIAPGSEKTDCDGDGDSTDELMGFQRIYTHSWVPGLSSNTFTSDGIGCVIYHPQHSHWHVASIARYSLFDEVTGELTDGNKVGFCLLDSGSISGSGDSFYNATGCGSPDDLPTLTGISPGFFDLYSAFTPGQRINITNLDPGKYCLRSKANPDSTLVETTIDNNVAEMRVKLNPERGVIKKVSRNCAL